MTDPGSPQRPRSQPTVRVYLGVWAALMILLALTVASSVVALGSWNLAINVGIAALKAVLVAVFFMRLRDGSPLVRLAALTAVAWVAILLGLTLTDVLARG